MNLSEFTALQDSPNTLSYLTTLLPSIENNHTHFDCEIKWMLKTIQQDISRNQNSKYSIELHKELTTIRANATKINLGLSCGCA